MGMVDIPEDRLAGIAGPDQHDFPALVGPGFPEGHIDNAIGKTGGNCKEKLESLSWLEQANDIQKRIDKYEEVIRNKLVSKDNLSNTISKYSEYSLCDYDLSEQNKLVEEIENIDIPDSSSLKQDIQKYENCLKENYDLSEQNKLVEEIENIEIPVKDELNKSIINYERFENSISDIETEIINLKNELPDIGPYCGAKSVQG